MLKLLLCLLHLCACSHGLNILGIFTLPAHSHYMVGSSLMKGLARAGHKVTFINPHVRETSLQSYEEVEISGTADMFKSVNFFEMNNETPIGQLDGLLNLGAMLTNHSLNEKNVQGVLTSGRQFDVIIVEIFISEALIALGRHFNAPVIAIFSFGATVWGNELVGNPYSSSFVPHPFLAYTENMDFVQRTNNFLMTAWDMYKMWTENYHTQEMIVDQVFPKLKGQYREILRDDVRLVLLNTHFTFGYPRPNLPNVIEVGGLHISRANKVGLPEDLQKLCDGAKNGVIYFSLGSNAQSKDLPAEKRKALLDAFGKLSQIWKWEMEEADLPERKPNNVIVRKWFPQEAILAHPNVKLFITHGGLLSLTEAIYYAKPVLGIPIFGDQMLNMQRAEQVGYGMFVEYQNVSEVALSWAVETVLKSDKVGRKIKQISESYRDQILSPLENAIYWVEYVARHKGAPQLQSHAKQLNFLQFHNLDVLGFIAAVLISVTVILGIMVGKVVDQLRKKSREDSTLKGKRE